MTQTPADQWARPVAPTHAGDQGSAQRQCIDHDQMCAAGDDPVGTTGRRAGPS